MKKVFLILVLMAVTINPVKAEEKQEVDEIQQQVEKYKEDCYNKVYPVNDAEKMDYILSLYNTSIKEYMKKYNSCLKEIIIEKIKQTPSISDVEEIIEALNRIEQNTLDFYSLLFAQTDTGIYGKTVDDSELGRRFEDILYAVLHYQSIYGNGLK